MEYINTLDLRLLQTCLNADIPVCIIQILYQLPRIMKNVVKLFIVSNLLITNNYINFNDFTRQELIIIMKDCVTCYRQIHKRCVHVIGFEISLALYIYIYIYT